jgi:hypothetical protein
MIIPSNNFAHFIEIPVSVYREVWLCRPWKTFVRNIGHLGQRHQKSLVEAEAAEI